MTVTKQVYGRMPLTQPHARPVLLIYKKMSGSPPQTIVGFTEIAIKKTSAMRLKRKIPLAEF